MKNFFILFATLILFFSCKKKENKTTETSPIVELRGVDGSLINDLNLNNIIFYNQNNIEENILDILKNKGCNLIRLRLWVNPNTTICDFNSIKNISNLIKSKGLKTCISIHFSDTWADPSQQQKPHQWENLSFQNLQDSIFEYSKKIALELNPDYVQIGNEINNGFLWPEGNISNLKNMKILLSTSIEAFKTNSPNTKTILHFAGHEGAFTFYSNFSDIDYDIIGLSYYPIWHGKDLNKLQTNMKQLTTTFNKKIMILETAYPFTFDYNDWTNNIIGNNAQIIPDYKATSEGQKIFLMEIKKIIYETPSGLGFCYWGGEWISYKGDTASNGSPWENQALWDFNHKGLPVLDCFQ